MVSHHPFLHIIPDCITLTFHFHIFTVEQTQHIKHGHQDWNFLEKYALCCELDDENHSMEFISECRDLEEKPSFWYVRPKPGCSLHKAVPYLRGIHELDLSSSGRCSDSDALFSNIRGIKKLVYNTSLCSPPSPQQAIYLRGIQEFRISHGSLWRRCLLDENIFDNLRGARSLQFSHCIFPKEFNFQNFRGVKHLHFAYCTNILPTVDAFKNLRGIEELAIIGVSGWTVTSPFLENLRGIQRLVIEGCSCLSLDDLAFSNLRGIQALHLHPKKENHKTTDSAFSHLRGVNELQISNFSSITSAFLKNLWGIKNLQISSCPNVNFNAEALQNLRGIASLHWRSRTEKLLDEACIRNLHGISCLDLDNVITTRASLRPLDQVTKLTLFGPKENMKDVPLDLTSFSHLKRVECLHLENLRLDAMQSFTCMLSNHLPNVHRFRVRNCRALKEALQFNSPIKQRTSALKIIQDKDENFVTVSFDYVFRQK